MSNVPPPPAAPSGDNDPADTVPPAPAVPPASAPTPPPAQPYAAPAATPTEPPRAPQQPQYTPPAQPYSAPPVGGAVPGTLPGATQPNQPYGQPGYGQPPYGAPAAAKPQTLSIVSMVTGIAGLLFTWVPILGFLASVAAVVTGHMAQSREPQAKPFWLTGLITGYVGIAMGLLFTVLTIFLFSAPFWFVNDSGTTF